MVALSPDTQYGDLWNSGYRYDDCHILNFSHVHNAQTAGIPSCPLPATRRVGIYRYTFPETEEAHILFDLTAALGPTKMSYAYVKRIGDNEIEGYSVNAPTTRRKKPLTVYFVARFDTPFDDFSGRKDNELIGDKVTTIEGENCGTYVTYKNLMIGGAPINQNYASEIGADGYSSNANAAVVMAKQLLVK